MFVSARCSTATAFSAMARTAATRVAALGRWASRGGRAWTWALVALLTLGTGQASAQTTVSTVTTPAEAVAIAVNPTQNIIYVTTGDNSLKYIDGPTNLLHTFSDPGAANTSGASAMVTYLNGVFVANSISNDISTYYVVPNGGAQFQGLLKDPNASLPWAMVNDPGGYGTLYVANKGSNTVSVFVNSGSGLTFTTAIPVQNTPVAMVLNLSTSRLYVLNSGSSTVSVIDTGSKTVIDTVDVGTTPQSIALNTVTNKIYVTDTGASDIVVINGANDSTQNINGITNNPAALTVNPLTNQIYVATLDGNIYIINGTTNAITTSVTAQVGSNPTGKAAIVVDPTTNVAFATIQGGNVTTVDGGSFATTNPPVGPGGNAAIALNPVTHRVYVDNGSIRLAVIDGATFPSNTISPGQSQPWAVAVNPATNKIYVANNGSSVTVIDGSSNTVTDTVATNGTPRSIAVDPAKNLIYVTNYNDASVTIINGSNDQAIRQPVTTVNPDSIAVDPVLEKVHGAASTTNGSFGFASNFGSNGYSSGTTSNSGPIAVSSNPAAGMAYTLFTDGNIEVDDESAPHSFVTGVCGSTGSTPRAMDVNPVTNTVYVACSGQEVDALQGASGFFGGNEIQLQDTHAISPVAVAVNPVTNQIYVANAGDGSGNGSVTVIDGTSNSVSNLAIGDTPVGIAVNLASGKVYVQCKTSGNNGTVHVIDPVGQFFLGGSYAEGLIGNLIQQIAVNPVNSTVYALDQSSNSFLALAENTTQATGPTVTVQPFANNIWNSSATPTFTFTASTGLDTYGPYVVYYQVDSRVGAWGYAGSTGANTFSGTAQQPLSPGFHVVYAYSVSGYETNALVSNNGSGFQYNPFVGSIASYGFIVAPPNAGTTYYPSDFGSQTIGTQSAAQQPLLSNHGGAPLSFSYAITGPNAADFTEVTYTGSDVLCNTVAGSLPSATFCDVNIAFKPSITGPESATLVFTDNSLGVTGSTQTVQLTGVGVAASGQQLTVNLSGTGTGTVSDGANFNCTSPGPCSQTYPTGTVVTLTASPTGGSLFTGWSGACTGTGTCAVTLSTAQTISANFYLAGAANCAAGDTVWVGGASGNWSVPANWSTGAVPASGANVCINNNHNPASSVTLDISASIGNLTINPGNSLTVGNALELVVAGTIANSGSITVYSNNANTFLTFSGAVTLTGGGTVTLNQVIANGQPILRNTNNGALTNVNNLIQGAGQFGNNGLIITNLAAGVVKANNAASPLQFNSGGVTNLGLLQAASGGTLQIFVNVVNKTGTVSTTGTGSTIQLYSGSTIHGGTLSTTAGGVISSIASNTVVLDGATLGAITIAGTYTVGNSSETVVSGTINNTGTIALPSNNANTFLTFSGVVTLTGGGTVFMNQVIANGQPILRNSNNGALVNVNNLIQGAGQLGNNGLLITNQAAGVINANGGFALGLNSGTVTNLGLIEATAGSTLQISVSVLNSGASILATGTGSTIQLYGGTTIEGGTISTALGGAMNSMASNTIYLDGKDAGTLTILGTYTVGNNSETVVSGTINNTGLISVPSNNANTFLTFSGPVTLTGSGTITMSQAISNGQPILRNSNNGTLLNVNNVIQGSGQLGNNGLLITNQPGGVILANGAFPLGLASATLTNLGQIVDNSGAALQISELVINKNASISVSGAGSTIQLYGGATIQGGTLSATGGGAVSSIASNTIVLDGGTQGALTLVGTYTVGNNSETVVSGTINNTGLISVLSNNANTFLTFSSVVTLTGGGTVNMNQAISNGQPILRNSNNGALVNVNNVIQGSGQLGNNGLLITNQAAGLVIANGAFALGLNSSTTNLGLIEAISGSTLQISTVVNNKTGTISSTGTGSAVQLYASTSIQGGTLSATNGGIAASTASNSILLDGNTQGPLTLSGAFTVANNSETIIAGTINNTGTITVVSNNANTFLTFSGPVTLTGGGKVTMSQAISNGQPILRNTNNGNVTNVNNLIQGAGQLGNNGLVLTNGALGVISSNAGLSLSLAGATFQNQGLLVIDQPTNPGAIPTTNFVQTTTGGLEVAIGGLTAGTQYSQLQNSGTTTLAGGLDIVLLNGFQPAVGNQFTVLTSTSTITGQFSSINSPALSGGLGWSLTYNPNSVVLTAVAGAGGSATLTITDLGTGTGTVSDNLGLINCTTTAGTISGTCSANYLGNSTVVLTATPAIGSVFNAWSTCSGAGPCDVIMNGSRAVSATFAPNSSFSALTVSEIGTGNGTVTDNLGQINCTTTAGVSSGTCTSSYPAGTVVSLTAAPSGTSSFVAWGNACSGTQACSVTLNSAQTVTASFAPAPQLITLSFTPGTGVTSMATYDCPSNPAPSPGNPCLDPNAHSLALSLPQVLVPFSITVQASEVPPSVADGLCPNGATPTTDFDCRFVTYFTYQTLGNGGKIVPLCYPYANGNCVHYLVYSGNPGVEPNPSNYVGPIDWTISWNNDHFTPPAPYLGSIPRVYDDPDYAVSSTAPFGTNCSTPMLVGNPALPTNPAIFCQFEFDITTSYNPTKPVDATITARTKQFNDVVVAFPPANVGNLTVTTTPSTGTASATSALNFTLAVSNTAGGPVAGATLSDALPAAGNVSWSISPAYTGPGSCAISGATGSQVLNCTFGTINASQAFTVGLLSTSASVGAYTNTAVVQIGNQQILSIGTITVQPINVVFSGLTPSQSIPAGTSSVSLAGIIGNGNIFPAPGETVSITINGATKSAPVGTAGAFATTFSTATIPGSGTPYIISYSYAGNSQLAAATDSSTTLTVSASIPTFALTVTEIGTGNGTVTDNQQLIQCTTTGGVSSGTCAATYPSGTVVTLTATPSGSSTFAGWSGACAGTASCAVTLNSAQNVTASFAPAAQAIPLTFPVGTSVTQMATYDCPSNNAPSPANPCLDPNAHSLALSVPQVLVPFTVTVLATEVPPSVADGLCPNGATPTTDFDCRFTSFFSYQTLANGGQIVPLCYPYANGNCVHYLVYSGTPGVEPNPNNYVGPIDWTISWNNDHFVPPAPYLGNTPRVYDDPDYAVSATAPFGTNCSTPMQVGNPPLATNPPIYCQFEFDITTSYNPTKPVDATITARTKQFNDVVVAFPPANAGLLTVTNTPDAATVVAGNPIGFTVAVANNSGGTALNATLKDPLPAGSGISWFISPAYSGPGTCAINGALGTQELDCTLGNIVVSSNFHIHMSSASSSVGNFTNAAAVAVTNQQLLSIGTITVTSAPQTITFVVAQTTAAYNSAFPVSATASSGLPVSIAASGACSLSAGTVTITSGTGTCSLTATQTGNGIYGAATPVVHTITAQKIASTSTITANSPNPSTTGQAVSIAFKVSGVTTPTGTVSVAASTGETCSSSLTGGAGSCSITFATSGARTLAATYSGDSNFNGSLSLLANQTVTGGSASTLTISPASVNFGNVYLGGIGLKQVTLSNNGTAAITVTKVAMSATGTGDYKDFGVVSLCPKSIAAGKNCVLLVGFIPLHDNPAGVTSTASVLVTDSASGSPQSIPLSAKTINPQAKVSNAALVFTLQKVGTTSASKTVTITNSGSSPLILGAIGIVGDYAIATGTTCAAATTLAPAQQCSIAVTFTPTVKGIRIGRLTITDNALIGEQVILLTGSGN